MQAISTKFIGPSNVKGSRYKATNPDGKSVTLSSDHALNSDRNHLRVAVALRDKMGWKGELIGGATKDGYAFVFADTDLRAA